MLHNDPLLKYNKLKRFSVYVADKMRGRLDSDLLGETDSDESGVHHIDFEIEKTDCLTRGDIYTKSDIWEKLDNIANCATLVEIRRYEDNETRIHNANYCHNPIVCPICSDRVSKRRHAIFSEPIRRAVKKFCIDPASPDWKPEYPRGYRGVYLATATIKDGPDLKERIDTILDSIKRMRKMGQKRARGHSAGEWSKVRAGVSNVEIKIGKGSHGWHVHIHFLLFTSAPIDYKIKGSGYFVDYCGKDGQYERKQVSKWGSEWFSATKGEGINFDLEPIEYRAVVHGKRCETFEESVDAQAMEVFKYATVLSEKKGTNVLSPAQYLELIQRRGTRRLFNGIGLLRSDKRNPESLISVTEREIARLEYVDKLDGKTYEVYSSQWQRGGTYGELEKHNGGIFADSDDKNTKFVYVRRRAWQAQAAIYQGEYRKDRNEFLKRRHLFTDKEQFERLLDEMKLAFRNKVRSLWQKFTDKDFIPEFLYDFGFELMESYRAYCLQKSGLAASAA